VVQLFLADGTGPTGAALASGAIDYASAQPSFSDDLVTISFSSPAELVAGQLYAIAVSKTGTGGPGSVSTQSGNLCPLGQLYHRPNSTSAWSGLSVDEDIIPFEVLGTFPRPAPDPTPEPEPGPAPKADGTLTIDANKGKVEKGRKVTLTGQLDVASNESCEQNRQIQLQRRLKSEDDSKFATFTTVSTDPAGNYSTKVKVKKTYFYRAVVGETDACDEETSNSQKVRVQKKKAAQEA
jgi:hypothetical protein